MADAFPVRVLGKKRLFATTHYKSWEPFTALRVIRRQLKEFDRRSSAGDIGGDEVVVDGPFGWGEEGGRDGTDEDIILDDVEDLVDRDGEEEFGTVIQVAVQDEEKEEKEEVEEKEEEEEEKKEEEEQNEEKEGDKGREEEFSEERDLPVKMRGRGISELVRVEEEEDPAVEKARLLEERRKVREEKKRVALSAKRRRSGRLNISYTDEQKLQEKSSGEIEKKESGESDRKDRVEKQIPLKKAFKRNVEDDISSSGSSTDEREGARKPSPPKRRKSRSLSVVNTDEEDDSEESEEESEQEEGKKFTESSEDDEISRLSIWQLQKRLKDEKVDATGTRRELMDKLRAHEEGKKPRPRRSKRLSGVPIPPVNKTPKKKSKEEKSSEEESSEEVTSREEEKSDAQSRDGEEGGKGEEEEETGESSEPEKKLQRRSSRLSDESRSSKSATLRKRFTPTRLSGKQRFSFHPATRNRKSGISKTPPSRSLKRKQEEAEEDESSDEPVKRRQSGRLSGVSVVAKESPRKPRGRKQEGERKTPVRKKGKTLKAEVPSRRTPNRISRRKAFQAPENVSGWIEEYSQYNHVRDNVPERLDGIASALVKTSRRNMVSCSVCKVTFDPERADAILDHFGFENGKSSPSHLDLVYENYGKYTFLPPNPKTGEYDMKC